LADRLASSLYGADVLATALDKVMLDGPLLEHSLKHSIARLLKQKDAYSNMYEAYRYFRDDPLTIEQREALRQSRQQEASAIFAPAPTLAERLAAMASLPHALETNDMPAQELLEAPQEIERNLTNFLTGYLRHGDLARAKVQAYERLEEVLPEA